MIHLSERCTRVRTCESVSPKASTYVGDVGDTATCTFQWKINWGDGSKVQTVVLVDPLANTYVLLASHTFPYTTVAVCRRVVGLSLWVMSAPSTDHHTG